MDELYYPSHWFFFDEMIIRRRPVTAPNVRVSSDGRADDVLLDNITTLVHEKHIHIYTYP